MKITRVFKSVIKSAGSGVRRDPEVRKIIERYPRLFRSIKKRLTPEEQFGLHLTIGASVAFVFVYFFFGILHDLIGEEALIQSDLRIINLVRIFRTPGFSKLMLFITYLGKAQVIVVGLVLINILLVMLKRWRHLIALTLSVAAGQGIVYILKSVIQRPRPPLVNALSPEASFSFPSGHAFVAFSFYGLLAYFLFRVTPNKYIKAVALVGGIVAILALGFSRVYLGVHWPSDVTASYASGAAWLTVFITALEIRKKFSQRLYGRPLIPTPYIITPAVLFLGIWLSYIVYYFNTHPLKDHSMGITNQVITIQSYAPANLFSVLPKTSETVSGSPMEPIHIVIVGTKEKLHEAFMKSGWYTSDNITRHSVQRLVIAAIKNQPYHEAPGLPSFWNTVPNELAYMQPTDKNSVRERHHIHIWQTPLIWDDSRYIWMGTAHFDRDRRVYADTFLPTHLIDPAIDKERDKVKDDLMKSGYVKEIQEFQIVEPTLGNNGAGDPFFTDGKAYLFFLE